MKALNVVDIETLFLSQSCILVKILHRHEYTKKILLNCVNEGSNNKSDLHESLLEISKILNCNIKTIIEYPDRVRENLLKWYFNQEYCSDEKFSFNSNNVEEKHKINEIKTRRTKIKKD